jgi:Tol biopolymer transport system component
MFVLPLTGERTAIELGRERGGRFSPDSRLVAFSSNQSGQFQIYVKDLLEATRAAANGSAPSATQVSKEAAIGGIAWTRDGKELFYLSQLGGQGVMAVDVSSMSPFQAGTPKLLFKLPGGVLAPAQLSNVSSPDGQRFVFALAVAPRRPQQ